jgi:hypothetical protein
MCGEWYPWQSREDAFRARQMQQQYLDQANRAAAGTQWGAVLGLGNLLGGLGGAHSPAGQQNAYQNVYPPVKWRRVEPKSFRLRKRLHAAWRRVKFMMSEEWEVRK